MKSRCHKDVVLKTVTIPASCRDIGETLSSQLQKKSETEGNVFSN